ncbi:MAG: UPF0182 family protein [Synechococcales cyanobacterium C42_A2020_086]|jgi:uncharacterized membrane protein (UPF0182 family)|nr:UPF0182 family protein [Synechococcales cyanobacterium C42_A2020_086]
MIRLKDYRTRQILRWTAFLVGGLILLDLATFFLAEGLWFHKLDYLQLFVTRISTQVGIGLTVFAISLTVLGVNHAVARRRMWPRPSSELDRPVLPGHMGIVRLLPVVLLLSLILAASLFYYGTLAANYWQPNFSLASSRTTVPLRFSLPVLGQLIQQGITQPWQPVVIGLLAVTLILVPAVGSVVVAILLSLGFNLVLSEHWTKLLLALHPVEFGETDPLFGRDLSFYIFSLPVWELLEFWLTGLLVQAFLSVSLIYLLSGDSLSQGYFPGFSRPQQQHLSALGGCLLLSIALGFWLDRYDLLYSTEGASYGASYTSATVELPVFTGLSLLAVPLALWLLGRSLLMGSRIYRARVPDPALKPKPLPTYPTLASARRTNPPVAIAPVPLHLRPLALLGLYVLLVAVVAYGLPVAVQQLLVQPNELQLEQPYLRRTIALTRRGFKLDEIDVQTFDPEGTLTAEVLQRNNLTIENIRLWDKRPLLETNRQLQRIRLYYEFPDADIDRYALPTQDGRIAQQQVLIAARELDYTSVPTAAQTWINQHLIYTHGYGFTVSPVNTAAEGGLPDYLIQGIGVATVDPRVRSSIPIGSPRIYYGESTNTYVMTNTRVKELDYPSGSDNVYNTYSGRGGVPIGAFWQRLLYAKHLRDWRMLLSEDLTSDTRLLFRRNITDRIRAIAPFLRYDSDPYLVVVDTGNKQWQRGYRPELSPTLDDSYLYWIIDAYTTSSRYPYSDPLENDFNYIRNSVKVVIDANHGSVNFYIADAQDPLIQAWSRVFPGVFQPLSAMPEALQRHIRYPQDFYRVQANQLMTYHMTDPVVFYNREDQWRAPNEIYGGEQQLVEPYYLIMKLPIGETEEFILLRPFTPAQRNNLIAWLSARSDGDQYGRMLLYTFPKQDLIFGPEQIEARINQDPVISERISLWNRQGSRVIQGNLLVIPIEQSLLYVEPIYLVAEQNQLPTLARVIVVYGNRIAMAESLGQALDAVFQPAPTDDPIIRTTDIPEETLVE